MKIAVTLPLCGFLALAGCDSGTGSGGSTKKTQTQNAQQPDFTLKDLDGKKVSLSSLRGKAMLLNFWAVG